MNSSGETEATAILADIEKLTKSGSQVLADDHHERALSIFKKAYLLSLKLPEGQAQKACLFNLGAAYIAVGKSKKGLKCLMKCKLKEPEGRDADMYFNIGIAYEEMKEYSKAVKFYQKAVNDYGAHQADNTADALIKLAYCSVNLKDPASAAHSFRLAGQSYQQAGRWDYAAMALRECASYMIQSQRFSKAGVQQVLKECHQICKGISHSSLKGKLLNDIGLHYAELKSFNQAEECFTEALGSCSGMSFSIRKRAVLLQNTGAIHNAMNQYEMSLKYHAEAADMYDALEERKAQGESLYNLAYAYSQMKIIKQERCITKRPCKLSRISLVGWLAGWLVIFHGFSCLLGSHTMGIVRGLVFILFIYHISDAKRLLVNKTDTKDKSQPIPKQKVHYVPKSNFRLYTSGDAMDDTCTILPFDSGTLDLCSFNSTAPLIIIVHGWSVDGMLESWVTKLAAALKSKLRYSNVVIADWLSLAHQHYAIAVQNTRLVGQEIADLLEWLEESHQFSTENVHLIGYSLGAHVSGFAGSYVSGSRNIGRITGLDPAGPLFEGMSYTDRLSPDDANFVDAIHTFTQQHMGLSVGIKQPVAHYDFYPNGGTFQPGCHINNLYDHLSQYGLSGLDPAGPLFEGMSYTDRLSPDDANFVDAIHTFTQQHMGLSVGIKQPVAHYDFYPNGGTFQPGCHINNLVEEITGNKTYTFLITLDTDIGDLMVLKFKWEGSAVWANIWDKVQTIMPWRKGRKGPELTVGRIRVKAGETQKKTSFCSQSDDSTHILPAQEKTFVRCERNSNRGKKKITLA
ncbi:UNVERIFIED_CONTAM: hypothetical protein FKN15_000486 [Acipenser sinensis]